MKWPVPACLNRGYEYGAYCGHLRSKDHRGEGVVVLFESGALLREEVLLVDKRGSFSLKKKRFLQNTKDRR